MTGEGRGEDLGAFPSGFLFSSTSAESAACTLVSPVVLATPPKDLAVGSLAVGASCFFAGAGSGAGGPSLSVAGPAPRVPPAVLAEGASDLDAPLDGAAASGAAAAF